MAPSGFSAQKVGASVAEEEEEGPALNNADTTAVVDCERDASEETEAKAKIGRKEKEKRTRENLFMGNGAGIKG